MTGGRDCNSTFGVFSYSFLIWTDYSELLIWKLPGWDREDRREEGGKVKMDEEWERIE